MRSNSKPAGGPTAKNEPEAPAAPGTDPGTDPWREFTTAELTMKRRVLHDLIARGEDDRLVERQLAEIALIDLELAKRETRT